MCALFSYIGKGFKFQEIQPFFDTLLDRGPDNTEIKNINEELIFGFHRLAINGLDKISNQPLQLGKLSLICNGEIYNYKKLLQKNKFEYQTHSDCEIILHLYKKYGIERTLDKLDGEFAFVLYDGYKNKIFAARDHLGVRPLYYGKFKEKDDFFFASEAKALTFCDFVSQFPTGNWWSDDNRDEFKRYFHFNFQYVKNSEKEICTHIKTLLTNAVKKRLMSDRKVGCLLSGGLDSSLICGITAQLFDNPQNLETFAIGLENSPDLEKAQCVADHIGSQHHNVQVTEKEFLGAIEKVIYTLGSFDVTTIRASVGHYLISHWVRKNSDVKVLLSGETSDEYGSYLYFQNAPNEESFQKEAIRLLSDIHFFDMKRGDRCISSAGLESRVPFSDKYYLKYYMSIPPKYRMFNEHKIEKYLLRKAFDDGKLLPDDILWRRKNGFSDSVSSQKRSWATIIQEHIDKIIPDTEFQTHKNKYTHCPPLMKEGYYYRQIFEKYYGKHVNLTPYQWLPKWSGEIVDPSARVLNIYQGD